MNNLFVILWMVFFHIVDDYYLQGWLASAKQKTYWRDNAPDKLYRYDYIWALIMHSFSWSFMIMLPIAYIKQFNIEALFVIVLVCNTIIHAIVDNLKANLKLTNLWRDQLLHMLQIGLTAFVLLFM